MPETQNKIHTELEQQLERQAKIASFRATIANARRDEANADKAIADANKAVADAEKAAIDNERLKWKGPEVKAPEGKLTANGNFIETEILANSALADVAAGLVADISDSTIFKEKKELTFVVYHSGNISAIELYQATIAQLKSLKDILADAIATAKEAIDVPQTERTATGGAGVMTVGMAAGGIIRTVADIFSLFKTNSAYTNYDLAADENFVVSTFAQAARVSANWKIYYPALYPVKMLDDTDNSNFISLLNEVRSDNKAVVAFYKSIETLKTAIDENLFSETDPTKKEILRKRKAQLSDVSLSLQSTAATFTQFETNLVATSQDTKVSMLIVLLQAERLAKQLLTDDTYVIKLNVKRSGSTLVKESLFSSAKATHSGGCQLSCLIFDRNGCVLYSNNANKYIPMSREIA